MVLVEGHRDDHGTEALNWWRFCRFRNINVHGTTFGSILLAKKDDHIMDCMEKETSKLRNSLKMSKFIFKEFDLHWAEECLDAVNLMAPVIDPDNQMSNEVYAKAAHPC
jgi:hypothetical protein